MNHAGNWLDGDVNLDGKVNLTDARRCPALVLLGHQIPSKYLGTGRAIAIRDRPVEAPSARNPGGQLLWTPIGNTRVITLKRTWSEPAIVWTAIIGDSGSMKSPALELVMKPIKNRQNDALNRHKRQREDYEKRLKQWEKEEVVWKRSTDCAKDPPEKPKEPIADRCWCDDVTIEALAVLLQNQPRRGTLSTTTS